MGVETSFLSHHQNHILLIYIFLQIFYLISYSIIINEFFHRSKSIFNAYKKEITFIRCGNLFLFYFSARSAPVHDSPEP